MVNAHGAKDKPPMKRNVKVSLVAFMAIMFQINTVFAKSNLTTTGDILQIAIPVTALSTSFYKDDLEGVKEFTRSFLVNTTITHALKFAMKDTQWGKRPNGGTDSFPSGHASSAFQGAFFLQKRYGTEYGAPAIGLAALTGYSRVKGDFHHWRDVIGSAVIAFSINYFIVDEYKDKVSINMGKDIAMLDFKLQF